MLFKKSRSSSSKQRTSDEGLNQGGLQSRWLVTSLALIAFAEKHSYFFPVGKNDWDDLPYDSNKDKHNASNPSQSKKTNKNRNKSNSQTHLKSDVNKEIKNKEQIIYSPNQEKFISGKWSSPDNPIFTSDSKYEYILHHQISNYISLDQINDNSNNEMKGNAIENQDTKKQREAFAQSLADNATGSNDSDANNSVVKSTILNQISTNPVLSEEYKHFLSVHAADTNVSATAQQAFDAQKSAEQMAQRYQDSASSASKSLESLSNVNNLSSMTNNQSMANQPQASDSVNSASVYYDNAKKEYAKVDSVYNFAMSVSGYINNSSQRYNDYNQKTHDNIGNADELMDQLDDDSEELSRYFNSLSADDQQKINNINQNVQKISTENDSIAAQLDESKSRVNDTMNQLSSSIDLVNSTYNDAKRFLSAADGSFNNSDENATKIYASYVSSAASKANDANDKINSVLNTFNSDLTQTSSYADKTKQSSSLVSSDSVQNNKILQNIKVQVAANSIAEAQSASAAAARSAQESSATAARIASAEAERKSQQASIVASQQASEASVRASEQASIAAAERSLAEAARSSEQASIAAAKSASAETARLSRQASLVHSASENAQMTVSSEQNHINSEEANFSVNDVLNDDYPSFDNSLDSTPISVSDPAIQEKLNTIQGNYNNASQMVNKMNDATKALVDNDQRLQDLFTLLKGELIQTKERAVKGNTDGMVAMMISKLDSLMSNASEVIKSVQRFNSENSSNYEKSIQALDNIKQYQKQLNSIIKISQSFDPLTSVSISSMADSTLKKTMGYYNQIKQYSDGLSKASKNIQSRIEVMKSYYQFASKNSSLMDSINQMSSLSASIDGRSNQMDAIYDEISKNSGNLKSYNGQIDSLSDRIFTLQNDVIQKQNVVNGYSNILTNNSSLADISRSVSADVQNVASAQNEVKNSYNDIEQTRSLAAGSIDQFNKLYSQVKLMSMNTKYQASQAVINFNIGNTSEADSNIQQMNSYQSSLNSIFSEASNVANGVNGVISNVSDNSSIDNLNSVLDSMEGNVNRQLDQASNIYNGLGVGISRANDIATNVSQSLNEAKEQMGSTDKLLNNVDAKVKQITGILKSISTSNDIAQLYSRQIVNQLNDANNPNSRKASDLARSTKQSFISATSIKDNLQKINDKLVQLKDSIPTGYSVISGQADAANSNIQDAFNSLSHGGLDDVNGNLDKATQNVNRSKQVLSELKSDINWLQSAVGVTDRLLQQSNTVNSSVSSAANAVQEVFNQLGLAN